MCGTVLVVIYALCINDLLTLYFRMVDVASLYIEKSMMNTSVAFQIVQLNAILAPRCCENRYCPLLKNLTELCLIMKCSRGKIF
jgi:hypothetical protein